MNRKGGGSGLAFLLILLAALLVAWLGVQQLGGLGVREQETQQTQQRAVDAAQDAVDAVNERMQENAQAASAQ